MSRPEKFDLVASERVAQIASECELLTQAIVDRLRKSAEIAPPPPPEPEFPANFTTAEAYRRACAALIWATFEGSSQNAKCERAARETGVASADTFARILGDETARIDARLMHIVKIIAHRRRVHIPRELAVNV